MIEIRCPQCENILQIDKKFAGVTGKCTHCGSGITVPQDTDSAQHTERKRQTTPESRVKSSQSGVAVNSMPKAKIITWAVCSTLPFVLGAAWVLLAGDARKLNPEIRAQLLTSINERVEQINTERPWTWSTDDMWHELHFELEILREHAKLLQHRNDIFLAEYTILLEGNFDSGWGKSFPEEDYTNELPKKWQYLEERRVSIRERMKQDYINYALRRDSRTEERMGKRTEELPELISAMELFISTRSRQIEYDSNVRPDPKGREHQDFSRQDEVDLCVKGVEELISDYLWLKQQFSGS